MPVTMTLQGGAELQRRFKESPQLVGAEVHSALQESLLLIESSARQLAPQDTRQLLGSITNKIEGSGINLIGSVGPSKAYGLFVEKGSRPHWPPINAITGWASRHGIEPFLVARAIARHGTKPQPFMQPALEKNLNAIEAIFNRIGAKIVATLAG